MLYTVEIIDIGKDIMELDAGALQIMRSKYLITVVLTRKNKCIILNCYIVIKNALMNIYIIRKRHKDSI